MTIKLAKYMNAGVREYWIVVVYNWENEEILSIYGFDTKVSVGIFEGKCEVELRNMNNG